MRDASSPKVDGDLVPGRALAGVAAGLKPPAVRARAVMQDESNNSTTEAATDAIDPAPLQDGPVGLETAPADSGPSRTSRGFMALVEAMRDAPRALRQVFGPSQVFGQKPANSRDVYRGLADGDVVGLEMLEFGHVDGQPFAAYTENGERMIIPLSVPQWMAAVEHRQKARLEFAEMARTKRMRQEVGTTIEETLGMMGSSVPPALAGGLRALVAVDPKAASQALTNLGAELAKDGGRQLSIKATAHTQGIRRGQNLNRLIGTEREVEVANEYGGSQRVKRRLGGVVGEYDKVVNAGLDAGATPAARQRALDLLQVPALVVDPRATSA